MSETVTTKCWCLSCDPKSGEIGLECKNRPTMDVEALADKIFYGVWPANTGNYQDAVKSAIQSALTAAEQRGFERGKADAMNREDRKCKAKNR